MTTIERLNNLVNNYKEYKQSYEYSEFYKIHRKDYDLLIKDIDVLLVNYNSLQLVSKILEEKVDKLKKQLEEYKEQVHKGLFNTCLPYTTGYNKAIKDKEIQQKDNWNKLKNI